MSHPWVAVLALLAGTTGCLWGSDHARAAGRSMLLVLGAPGLPEYATNFHQAADRWQKAARDAGFQLTLVGTDDSHATNDLVAIREFLTRESKEDADELWIVFHGHGTFDGQRAKFNLRGPDLAATELATWLQPFRRPLIVINASSASGPFLKELSGPERLIVTATRSGYELNYSRFGDYLSRTIADPGADLDKDGQTSLLEAFLAAAREVAGFYQTAGRLASEHALLDDNGDGLGTPPDWFRGVRLVKSSDNQTRPDGQRAHQIHLVRSAGESQLSLEARQRRDQLEQQLAALRERKSTLPPDEYYQALEAILLDLARIYEK